MAKSEDAETRVQDLLELIHFTENISAKIHGLLDKAEIFRTAVDEFRKTGRYRMAIRVLSEDGSTLRVVEMSIPQDRVNLAEEKTGVNIIILTIDLEKSNICRQVVKEGKTLHVKVRDIYDELLPKHQSRQVVALTGDAERTSIFTPIKRNDQIIGMLSVSSPELAEYFIPSVKNLARHISTAIELAKENMLRKHSEQTVRSQNAFFQDTIEALTHPFYVIDAHDYTITMANSAAKPDPSTPTQYCYTTTHRRTTPCSGTEYRCPLDEVKKTKQPVIVEHTHYDKDGNLRTFEVHGYPLTDEKGNVTQMIEYSLDITESVEAEKELKDSEEKWCSNHTRAGHRNRHTRRKHEPALPTVVHNEGERPRLRTGRLQTHRGSSWRNHHRGIGRRKRIHIYRNSSNQQSLTRISSSYR